MNNTDLVMPNAAEALGAKGNRNGEGEKLELGTQYLVNRSWVEHEQFEKLPGAISALLDKHYDTGISPLRTWWMNDTTHFQKIDQAHHASNDILEFSIAVDLGKPIADRYPELNTLQIWSSSLYLCPQGDASALGLHYDSQYTPFMDGDYFVAWIPLDEVEYDNFVLFDNVEGKQVTRKYCDVLQQNIDLTLAEFSQEYSFQQTKLKLSKGDVLFLHSNCLHALLPNSAEEKHRYLVVYIRSEENSLLHDVPHHGLCKHLNDFRLSPIVYHRSNKKV